MSSNPLSDGWEYHHYVSTDAPMNRRYQIIMYKLAETGLKNKKLSSHSMSFFSSDKEGAQNKVNEFWNIENDKARIRNERVNKMIEARKRNKKNAKKKEELQEGV